MTDNFDICNEYKKMIRFLLDVVNNKKELDREHVGLPYPKTRYVYATSQDDKQRFYRLLDLCNFSYYINRFPSLEQLIEQTKVKSEKIESLLRTYKASELGVVEVLKEIDSEASEIIGGISPLWYIGILEETEQGKIAKFDPK